jgi:hypothetical protein
METKKLFLKSFSGKKSSQNKKHQRQQKGQKTVSKV